MVGREREGEERHAFSSTERVIKSLGYKTKQNNKNFCLTENYHLIFQKTLSAVPNSCDTFKEQALNNRKGYFFLFVWAPKSFTWSLKLSKGQKKPHAINILYFHFMWLVLEQLCFKFASSLHHVDWRSSRWHSLRMLACNCNGLNTFSYWGWAKCCPLK